MSFYGVAVCLDAGQSRGEVGLKLRQAFDVGSGRLVVVMYLFQRDFGIAQPLCEAVAIGHRLRQRTIELCPLPRELGGRRRQCGVVPLVRIAQGGVRVCECVRCLSESKVEGVAGALNVGELGGEVGFALRQAFDVGSSRLLVATDLVEGRVGICDGVLESGARRAFVPDLLLEFRLVRGGVL